MAGLVPAIHVVGSRESSRGRTGCLLQHLSDGGLCRGPTWMAGTSPAMTDEGVRLTSRTAAALPPRWRFPPCSTSGLEIWSGRRDSNPRPSLRRAPMGWDLHLLRVLAHEGCADRGDFGLCMTNEVFEHLTKEFWVIAHDPAQDVRINAQFHSHYLNYAASAKAWIRSSATASSIWWTPLRPMSNTPSSIPTRPS
jgi:hypothetical protein